MSAAAALLSALLALPSASEDARGAYELGLDAPPSPERGETASGFELSPELGDEMRGELAKAQEANLEIAASRAEEDAAKTYRFVNALASGLSREFLALNRMVGGFLPPDARLREDLDDDVQRLSERETALREAAASAGLAAQAQDASLSRTSFRPNNRGGDLKRAERDAAEARKLLRIRQLPADSKAVADALDEYVGALERATKTVKALASTAPAPRQTELAEKARLIGADFKYLEREAKLLRAYLILKRADRLLTGKASD